eukprot:1189572-Prorocentrum_minimum.AAC.4
MEKEGWEEHSVGRLYNHFEFVELLFNIYGDRTEKTVHRALDLLTERQLRDDGYCNQKLHSKSKMNNNTQPAGGSGGRRRRRTRRCSRACLRTPAGHEKTLDVTTPRRRKGIRRS